MSGDIWDGPAFAAELPKPLCSVAQRFDHCRKELEHS
jgi:hypothetical protein